MDMNQAYSTLFTMYGNTMEQRKFRNIISAKVRKMEGDLLFKAESLFIPNDKYIIECLGNDAFDKNLGFYFDGKCNFTGNLVVPIRNIVDETVGLVGFNPELYLRAKETGDRSIPYYTFQNKQVFTRGNFMFYVKGVFEKAYNEGYLCIADGLFDCLHVQSKGLNAASLLGSTLTDAITAQLRFFKKVVLLQDNDEAGLKLERELKKSLHNVVVVRQAYSKDADGVLKTDKASEYLKLVKEVIEFPYLIDRNFV